MKFFEPSTEIFKDTSIDLLRKPKATTEACYETFEKFPGIFKALANIIDIFDKSLKINRSKYGEISKFVDMEKKIKSKLLWKKIVICIKT